MTRRAFLKALGIILSGSLLSVPGQKSTASSGFREQLEGLRRAHGVPALGAAFVRSEGVVALEVVGVRRSDDEGADPIQLDDRFHLGSCTKAMTATLLARFVEEGELAWETTLAEALPREVVDKIRPVYRGVTLHQLLAHRGGLPDDRVPDPELWPRVRALSGPLPEQRLELARLVLSRPPAAAPGSRFLYSNAGYAIAAAFAEQWTGKSWEELIEERLFMPLGMATAGFGPPGPAEEAPWGHTANGCRPVPPGPDADNPPVLGPAGRVHSALADWAKFAALHLRGARGEEGLPLRPETFQELHEDRYRQGYALGWVVTRRDWAGGTALTHAGSNTLWFAVVWLAPRRDAAFLAATNCGSERAFRACDAAIAAMIRRYL